MPSIARTHRITSPVRHFGPLAHRCVLSLALLALLVLTGAATAQTRHPFLWKVEAKNGEPLQAPCFLFGTMHLGDERLVKLPKVVEDALESADAVYCELALDKAEKKQVNIIKIMVLPKGKTLRDQLPKDVYELLDSRLQKYGASAERLGKFRVWAIEIILAQLEAAKLHMMMSLDKKIYMAAKDDDKEVGGLETLDEQMDAIRSGSLEDQVARLRESLEFMNELEAKGESSMAKMLAIYLTGDEPKLLDYVEEAMGDDDELNRKFLEPLLYDRNVRMADRIAEKLDGNPAKKYVFAVGAMHFVGEKGLTALLRKKGYRIVRLHAPTPSWERYVEMRVELSKLRAEARRLKKEIEALKKEIGTGKKGHEPVKR